MRQRETDCNHPPRSGDDSDRTFPRPRAAESPPGPPAPPPRPPGEPPNAFSPEFLERVAAREPAPATPEAGFAGPWRVVKLYGTGEPEWGCLPEGQRRPFLVVDSPDLAYLAAAALEVADRPARFRFRERPAAGGETEERPGAVTRRGLEVFHDGHPVGSAALAGDTLPVDLTRLADLRLQPRALAYLLLSVPEEVLWRAGAIVAELARKASEPGDTAPRWAHDRFVR